MSILATQGNRALVEGTNGSVCWVKKESPALSSAARSPRGVAEFSARPCGDVDSCSSYSPNAKAKAAAPTIKILCKDLSQNLELVEASGQCWWREITSHNNNVSTLKKIQQPAAVVKPSFVNNTDTFDERSHRKVIQASFARGRPSTASPYRSRCRPRRPYTARRYSA